MNARYLAHRTAKESNNNSPASSTGRGELNLRGVRSTLLAAHRRGYVGIIAVATVTGVVVSASLNALQLASVSRISSGPPHEAVRFNTLLDLMVSFNAMVVGMGALSTVILLSSVASFALEPRVPELARLSLVGMTRLDLVRLTVRELAATVLLGSSLGSLAGIPASIGFVLIERSVDMAPKTLDPRALPGALVVAWLITVTAGLAGGLAPVLRVASTRPLDVQAQKRAGDRKTVRRTATSVVILAALVVTTLVPADVIPADISVLLVIPLATILVTINGAFFLKFVTRVLGLLPGTRHRPRFLVALSNASAGGASALSATQSIVLVFSLVIPVAMVMATGRQAFQVEANRPLKATSIATFTNPPTSSDLNGVQASLSEPVVPYGIVSDLVDVHAPYAADQPSILATDMSSLPTQLTMTVTEGDTAKVRGPAAASASSRYAVGDTVDLLRPDGSTYQITVVAKIASNQYLSNDLVLDYTTNASQIPHTSLMRWLSGAQPQNLRQALDAHSVNYQKITDRNSWIQQGIHQALTNQRQAISMIFLVPCLLAAAATVLGVRAYSQVTAPSRARMLTLGFTARDRRIEHLSEIFVQLIVVIIQLVISLTLAWWKTNLMSQETQSGLHPVLDVPVTLTAAIFMFIVFIASHAVLVKIRIK